MAVCREMMIRGHEALLMIKTWSQGPAEEGMPEKILIETLEKVRRHPWWLARARLALALLQRERVAPPARLLEVGCGWGVNLEALERAGYSATGLDISKQILERIDKPSRQLIEADLNQEFPPQIDAWDALLALDVIEHVDQDGKVVTRLARLVRPGGLVVISVPARPDLWSEFDQVQGHRRRYVPETLRAVFLETALELRTIFWWGRWMVPILRRMRLPNPDQKKTYADYLRLPPWPGSWLMNLLFAWEQSRALDGRLSTGTSLFAVARRGVAGNQ
jgi:SAM-dependent methyltransferase